MFTDRVSFPSWRFAFVVHFVLLSLNLMLSFSCSLLELQVFVTEIVSKFALTLPADDSAKPCYGLTLVPKTADGVQQIPIHVEHVA